MERAGRFRIRKEWSANMLDTRDLFNMVNL